MKLNESPLSLACDEIHGAVLNNGTIAISCAGVHLLTLLLDNVRNVAGARGQKM